MTPPVDVCEALYRINPKLRVAWYGRQRRYPEELNPGEFAMVQLFHRNDVGNLDDPHIFDEIWDVGLKWTDDGKVVWGRTERGPVFTRHGKPGCDWDPLFYIPVVMFVANGKFDSFGRKLTNESFFDGHFLASVVSWRKEPRHLKARKSRVKAGKDLANDVDALTTDMAKELHWRAGRTGEGRTVQAKKHFKEDPYYERMKKNRERDLSKHYLLPGDE